MVTCKQRGCHVSLSEAIKKLIPLSAQSLGPVFPICYLHTCATALPLSPTVSAETELSSTPFSALTSRCRLESTLR